MEILKTVTFYCLLLLCSFALLGCGRKAEENKSISDVKTETEEASAGLLVPIISISVALVVGVLSFCASYLNTRSQVKNAQRELRDSYMKSIFDKRIDAYSGAWKIIGELSKAHLLGKSPSSSSQISKTIQELISWYNSGGGFLLSPKSRKQYFELRELCFKLKAIEINRHTDREECLRIHTSKTRFRESLRRDVFLMDAPWEEEKE